MESPHSSHPSPPFKLHLQLRTKYSVLSTQQRRLDSDIEAHSKEVAKQERQFKALQVELIKLNQLVNRNRGIQHDLQQATVLMEADYLKQLKVGGGGD